jgi:hypothetical protein
LGKVVRLFGLIQTKTDQKISEKRKLEKNVPGKNRPCQRQATCHRGQTANHIGDFLRVHAFSLPQSSVLIQRLAEGHLETKLAVV